MEGVASAPERLIMIIAISMALIQPSFSSSLLKHTGNQQDDVSSYPCHNTGNQQDTAYLRQQLQNGRIWQKRYTKVSGHEFFMTEALAEASVTADGMTFNDLLIWYDIFNDRVVLMVRPGLFIELNSENASQFTLRYLNRNYMFRYFKEKGYCQLLYNGQVLLVKKYVKVIKKNAVNGNFDAFEEEISDYLIKDGRFTRLRTRKDLYNVLADRETEVRHFIRDHDISVNPKRSESLIPVLEFYDSL